MDYNRDKFEQYATQMGHRDFERNEFDDYRNPFMQDPWNFWRASRDAMPSDAAQAPEPVAWQWRAIGHDWSRSQTFLYKPQFTEGVSEIRPLYAVPVAADAAAQPCTRCQPFRDGVGELVLPLCRCKMAAQPDERAAFEAWARRVGHKLELEPDSEEYASAAAEAAWEAWQARATALQAEQRMSDAGREEQPSWTNPMTPYGMLVRALRIVAGTTLMDMATFLGRGPAELSGLEFGRKPVTNADIVDAAHYFASQGIQSTTYVLTMAARKAEIERIDRAKD